MNLITSKDKIEIRFDISDTTAERNMMEYNIRSTIVTLQRMREIEERVDKLYLEKNKENI